jgi:protein-tyrosine-phosphatase
MAAAWFRQRAAAAGLSHVVVESAGTLGIEGEPAARECVGLLRSRGCDLSGHRSRGVRASDVHAADLIVVMELEHLEILAERFPAAADKVVLLRAFEHGPDPEPGAPDLEDPIGGSPEAYLLAFERIRACLDGLVLHLRHRA